MCVVKYKVFEIQLARKCLVPVPQQFYTRQGQIDLPRYLRQHYLSGSKYDFDRKPFKVLIAGGGIAGLALAHMLEKFPIDYLLSEAHSEIDPNIGASIGIGTNRRAEL